MATIEMPIAMRRTLSRPSASDIQPESIRPATLPAAPTIRAEPAAAVLMPRFMANGTSWLVTINADEVPRAYAIHMR